MFFGPVGGAKGGSEEEVPAVAGVDVDGAVARGGLGVDDDDDAEGVVAAAAAVAVVVEVDGAEGVAGGGLMESLGVLSPVVVVAAADLEGVSRGGGRWSLESICMGLRERGRAAAARGWRGGGLVAGRLSAAGPRGGERVLVDEDDDDARR
ncbi:hypothetical protein ABW21_db0205133 [Orbilia brochopaga]|nr:hypothetical protein ABW21_db0205133 [Drechslerella brochopaga]